MVTGSRLGGLSAFVSEKMPALVKSLPPAAVFAVLAAVLIILAAVVLLCRKRKNTSATAPARQTKAEDAEQAVRVAHYQQLGGREEQQDSYGISAPSDYDRCGILAVVADGMGGMSNGSAVSAELVNSVLDTFSQSSLAPAELLLNSAAEAQRRLAQSFANTKKGGSTLAAALIRDGRLYFLSVGDSRIYLCRNGGLIQLTREHIYREELALDAVNMRSSIDSLRTDPQTHALTSYFGLHALRHIDRNSEGIHLLHGDRVLIMTDGVFGTVSEEKLEKAMLSDMDDAVRQISETILQTADPYQDNNTAVLFEYE